MSRHTSGSRQIADLGCHLGRFLLPTVLVSLLLCSTFSCSSRPDPNTLVMIIESSPTNLDPRVGIDAQSERIDSLIFDDLLSRGDDLNVAPGLAERWEFTSDRAALDALLQRGCAADPGVF